jgi:SpoVK/Ycf46/Vps4 family AAA+-type ATPase
MHEIIEEASGKTQEKLTQWGVVHNEYFGIPSSVPVLPPGIYSAAHDTSRGIILTKMSDKSDDLIIFRDDVSEKILKEIDVFWKSTDKFRSFGLVQKRGILLYGPPGAGKTCLCRQILAAVVKANGIALNATAGHFRLVPRAVDVIREVQPETPLVILIEEIDRVFLEDPEALLNSLDGVGNSDLILFLGTTNNIDRLDSSIVNRPSRFDRVVSIGPLSRENRRFYIESLKARLHGSGERVDVDQWVVDTEGLTIAHVKELFTSTYVLGSPYDTALLRIRSMRDEYSKNSSGKPVGFVNYDR